MKSESTRTRATSKLSAGIFGACLAAGLLAAAVTPAHAEVWNPYGGYIPYTYTNDNGDTVSTTAFRAESKTWNRGWFPGFGVRGEQTALGAVRFTQLQNSPKICVQIYKYSPGWSTPQEMCTSGMGTQVTLGEESTYSIQAMNVRLKDCTYNDNLTGDSYMGAIVTTTSCSIFGCTSSTHEQAEWQSPITTETCAQKIRLGAHIGSPKPPYMAAYDLKIKRNDSNCATCSSNSAPVTGGVLRPVGQ
jgi:hypothetical protein